MRPRLVLLNGLPTTGKSTVARAYVARHPGVLRVEADELRIWIGGDPADHAEASRHLSLALAEAHLRTGHDVLVPQLVARPDQVDRFAGAAHQAGAAFWHVVLDSVDEPSHSTFTAGLEQVLALPGVRRLPRIDGDIEATVVRLETLLEREDAE